LSVIDVFSGKGFATVTGSTSIDEMLVYLQKVVFQVVIPMCIHGDKALTHSSEFINFCKHWDIKLLDSASSRSQGAVECFNRILQAKLLEHGIHSEFVSREAFQTKLSQIVLMYNNTPKESRMELTPNEILLGWKQEVPEEEFKLDEEQVRRLLFDRESTHKFIHDAYAKEDQPEDGYQAGDLILQKVKTTLKRGKNVVRNWGPYVVLENLHNGSVRIQLPSGDHEIVPEKDIVKYVPGFQPSEGGGDDGEDVDVQSKVQPHGEVFMLPKPVASEHLAESGTFRNA